MMSPVYLNPQHSSSIPFLELKGDQQHNNLPIIMGYVHDHVTTTNNNNNTYFSRSSFESENTSNEFLAMDYSRCTQERVVYPFNHGDQGDNNNHNNAMIIKSDQKSKKCKQSKVGITQKTTTTEKLKKIMTRDHKLGDHGYLHAQPKSRNEAKNNNNVIRMCTDCHTSTTPLWRSGPHGPKSLCNACGIRQRKARRAAAMAAAAATATTTTTFAMDNGPLPSPMSSTTTTTTTMESPKPTLNLDHHQETIISHTLPLKKRSITFNHYTSLNNNHINDNSINNNNYNNYDNNDDINDNDSSNDNDEEKSCVEDFAWSNNNNNTKPNYTSQRVYPKDEVEGALLLMALSCGLPYSSLI